MLNVVYLGIRPENPPSSYYDHGLISHLFDNFVHTRHLVRRIPEGLDGAVVVIPARNQVADLDQINIELNKLRWCLVILTGDEESVFPFEKISHPNFRVWVMSPQQGRHDSCFNVIGSGFRVDHPATNAAHECPTRDLDYFFSGQIRHEQRVKVAQQLRSMSGGIHFEQPGFAQGFDLPEYLSYMRRAKFVPAPCGPVSPDNFRLYEALETGAIPIGDGGSFWPYLFREEVPFPIISDWTKLKETMPVYLSNWKPLANKTFAWWQQYKRRMADKLEDHVKEISGQEVARVKDDQITVLISTSVIPSHPSTEMIERTIKSVRDRLPNSEIIVMIDGLRPDMLERHDDYEQYKQNLLWKINNHYENMIPVVMDTYSHQSGQTREALKLVRTPLILFVEHDTPLVGEIPFDQLGEVIKSGRINTFRLNHETLILPDHKYLQLDLEPVTIGGVPLVRSTQWSQRPHLSSSDYYRKIVNTYCDIKPRFIEHVMYGVVVGGNWNDHKLAVYHPEGSILRSSNLNGVCYQVGQP